MVKIERRTVPKPCKLINSMNNCFFNSIIQCTIYTHPITTFFENASFKDKQKICLQFQNFIRKYMESRIIDPQFFLVDLKDEIPILDGNEQDAQEFLLIFYGKLTEELGFCDDMVIESKTELRRIGRENIMIKTFYGLILNRLVCLNCSNVAEHVHQFGNLTLEVADSMQESIDSYINHRDRVSEIKCGRCREISDGCLTKKIVAYPEVLIVQLSRFIDIDHKNDKYMVINQKIRVDKRAYHLKGMVCHSGTLRNGHYVAYAKIDTTWHSFDDTTINEVNDSKISSNGAYILFYSRI